MAEVPRALAISIQAKQHVLFSHQQSATHNLPYKQHTLSITINPKMMLKSNVLLIAPVSYIFKYVLFFVNIFFIFASTHLYVFAMCITSLTDF